MEKPDKQDFSIEETTKGISISNGIIGLKFFEEEAGFGLYSIKNEQKYYDFLLGQTMRSSLWEIELKHASNRFVTIDNNVECNRTYNIEKSADGSNLTLHMYWKDISLDTEEKVVNVHATVRLNKSSLSYWQINVENKSKQFGTWEITYPSIKGLRASEDEDVQLAYPDFHGGLLKNPVKRISEMFNPAPPQLMEYPSAHCTMQFSTLFERRNNNGLYLATHDSEANVKKFGYDVDEKGRSLKYRLRNYPEGMGVPGSGSIYKMPYEIVIGVYEGDWITASKIYRDWAINQKWCSKGNLSQRKDIPGWYLNTPIWFAGLLTDKMIPLAKYLDVPTAFHWYNWWEIPKDGIAIDPDYLDYIPDKELFSKEIKNLSSAGIKIMPYINSRIWAINTKSWKNEYPDRSAVQVPFNLIKIQREIPQWRTSAWQDLTIHMDHWGGGQQAVMCPYTKVWQNKQSEIITRLVSDYGVDGVYMDQVASFRPAYCFDSTHGHPIGGGSHWVEGNRKMVEICKENASKKNPEIILTTEDFAEPYIDVFDGLLACNASNIAPYLIPMFNYVYSGYCLTFGRYTSQYYDKSEGGSIFSTGLPFMMRNAQMFLWGEQMGWFDPNILSLESPEAKYLKALCKALDKEEVKKFLIFGEMLCPPKLEGDNPILSAAWNANQNTEMPAVSHSAWKAEDGTLGLVFTNLDNSAHTISYSVDTKQYKLLQTQKYSVKVIDGIDAGKVKRFNSGSFVRTEKMPARSVLVLEIKADEK